jgi:hypothetical protein
LPRGGTPHFFDKEGKMRYLELLSQEVRQVENLLSEICPENTLVETDQFLRETQVLAHELPKRIRRELYELRLFELSLGICIKHNPVRTEGIGPTPDHIPSREEKRYVTREEVLHILYASLLGEVFGWSSIQNGNIVNEVIPLKENEEKPMSSGSKYSFGFHTEDAFHPYSGDYFGLMCLRNPTKTATVISFVRDADLDPETKRILFEPRFTVGANIAHNVKRVSTRVPILFGDRGSPYLRINLNADPDLQRDTEAQMALEKLIGVLTKNALEVPLESGDCFYLDNFRVVHGRSPYAPKYDGNDRWLKRLYITSYLRKSRDLRVGPDSRIVLNPEDIDSLYK